TADELVFFVNGKKVVEKNADPEDHTVTLSPSLFNPEEFMPLDDPPANIQLFQE
nr:xanthine oxidase (EC 1.1.3.22) - bovine (fragments) [Bos indicus]